MVSSLRHKRSAARLISSPIPTSASTLVFETADGHRSSGDSFVPSDGYSSLFASGLLRQPMVSPSLSAFPSPPQAVRGPFHPSPEKPSPTKSIEMQSQHSSPHNLSPAPSHLRDRLCPPSASSSPNKTPVRRRRSSIMHSTPMSASPRVIKQSGLDGGVERALDNVMKSLKVMAMGTPRKEMLESRWSSSSEESLAESADSGFWRSRKSSESVRSKVTIATMKSSRSIKSKKSRKSEDTDRMDIDLEDIPPVPTTPGRSRRMMNGLVKRLGLTPRKNKNKPAETAALQPGLPPPPPERIPRKSSLSTLRSVLTKKTSTGTLRSVRSNKSLAHPFMNAGPTFDCEAFPPPVPRWNDGEHGQGCVPLPSTPQGRRTPKSSIGQPRLRPSTSPNTFLREHPRRAPSTPKQGDIPIIPPMPGLLQDTTLDSINFGTPRMHDAPFSPPLTTPAQLSHEDADAVEIISFNETPPPLTTRAAAQKPKKLLNLLPRHQRANLGMQTPPSTGLRSKKSTQNISHLLNGTPLQARNTNIPSYLATPESARASPILRRDPLGIIGRFDNIPITSASVTQLPFRSGAGDGWGTPALEKTDAFDKKTVQPKSPAQKRRPVPDFTASPVKSMRSAKRFSLSSMTTAESDLPTEEWELEAYLKELDRVDREKEAGMGR